MAKIEKRNYEQTNGKIRVLWEQANRLIAKHEDLQAQILDLKQKNAQLNSALNNAIEGTNNV